MLELVELLEADYDPIRKIIVWKLKSLSDGEEKTICYRSSEVGPVFLGRSIELSDDHLADFNNAMLNRGTPFKVENKGIQASKSWKDMSDEEKDQYLNDFDLYPIEEACSYGEEKYSQ